MTNVQNVPQVCFQNNTIKSADGGDVCEIDAKTSIHTYIEHTYLY
jgi:hypothetical protein